MDALDTISFCDVNIWDVWAREASEARQEIARQREAERADRVAVRRRAVPVTGLGYTHPTRPRR
jgi:hypothetical protein